MKMCYFEIKHLTKLSKDFHSWLQERGDDISRYPNEQTWDRE